MKETFFKTNFGPFFWTFFTKKAQKHFGENHIMLGVNQEVFDW